MKFDAGTRTRLLATLELDFDPTGSTVEVKVDGTWHAATWQGGPVQKSGRWTQTARTTDYFAGPEAVAEVDEVVLDAGRHLTQTRVTSGQDVLVADSSPIDVG